MESLLKHCHQREYPARSTLIREGDRPDTLYYIISGSVCVQTTDEDGHEIVLAYLEAGSFVGEMGLFRPASARSAWVVTRTACQIAEIDYEKFRRVSVEEPKVLYALGEQLADRLEQTNRKVLDLAFLDVTGRVAATLQSLVQQPSAVESATGRTITITRSELARVVGCSREMCSRVMKELEAQGLVSSSGRRVTVHGPVKSAG